MRSNKQKLTLLSSCVLVYDSAREPVIQSVRGSACEQSTSSSDFEAGGANSGDNFPRRASRKAPPGVVAESY